MEKPVISHDDIHFEQARYALVLHWSTLIGFIILVASFVVYVFGWLPSHVPLSQLPHLWALPVDDYLKATQTPTGWNWLKLVENGDFATLLGVAWLCACSVFCMLAVLPIYFRRRDWVSAVVCILAIAVQLFAASGTLGAGH